ncbi:MAG TPA: NADH-quinone oxidoreductase subunit NuoH [Egibacteraceae bacterium]|nr:NADH-quinone oxidoreductase subunit NuoH [Actinomycetota bacterium]HWB71360.1 NADH-quinone oxidoreductase subunit NuoH [Egibacteraceae bacterium]
MESLLSYDNLWLALALKLALVVVFFLTAPLVVGYLEHKALAHMQSRLGPMEAGRFHGIGQLPADGVKFLQKEDVIPAAADRWVFALAPGVALVPVMVVLAVVPLGPGLWAENLDAGIFFALAASSVGVIGILMAAWSSANKYSLMGGLRAAAQMIAYELPLVLAAAAVVLQAETLSLVGIVEAQSDFRLLGALPVPYAVPQAVGLVLFFVAALAELSRPPFDMPIADSEIIFGHMTEYTGIRYALFMLAEYAGMVVLSALATVLFLGGWYLWPGVGLPGGVLGALLGFGITFGKIAALTFVMIWFRATFPRLREDQLQRMSWLILIPLALANIVVVSVFKVVG